MSESNGYLLLMVSLCLIKTDTSSTPYIISTFTGIPWISSRLRGNAVVPKVFGHHQNENHKCVPEGHGKLEEKLEKNNVHNYVMKLVIISM